MTEKSPNLQRMMNAALQHHQHGRFWEAEQIYKQILAINPRHPDSLHLLGMIAYQAGDFDTAADLIKKAIAIHSTGTSYFVNLGTVLQAQGKLDEAVALYRHSLTLKPNLTEIHVNLGNVLLAQGELDESVVCFERALALKPDSAEAHNNLGNALHGKGKLDEALAVFQRALTIKPDYAEVHYNMGSVRRAQDRLDDAVTCYRLAIGIRPDYPEAHYNLGNVLRERGKVDEALEEYEIALALWPDYAQAGFGEALAQLLQGNFGIGWQNYERRWKSIDHDTPRRTYSEPLWAGEKLEAGNLLIWAEQGVGDEIMFAGFIPEVLHTGNRCVLECNSRLKPLFARSFPDVEVVSGCGPGSHAELEIASQIPGGSLPGLFRKATADFAATTSPYLIADRAERDRLRSRYDDGRKLIGLAWYTNSVKNGRFRCIDLALLSPLLARPEIRLISLQYGDHDDLEKQVAAARGPILIDRDVDQLADMDLFAAQIAAMDLVITIDNSTAHLAGALGVPVWVLLPFAPDWRWLLDREDSPWYPTMRLFRQPKPGDWQSVVERVNAALTARTT